VDRAQLVHGTVHRQDLQDLRLVLVGDPRRSYFPADDFVPVASYEVPVTRELEDAEIKRAAVWQLRE